MIFLTQITVIISSCKIDSIVMTIRFLLLLLLWRVRKSLQGLPFPQLYFYFYYIFSLYSCFFTPYVFFLKSLNATSALSVYLPKKQLNKKANKRNQVSTLKGAERFFTSFFIVNKSCVWEILVRIYEWIKNFVQ